MNQETYCQTILGKDLLCQNNECSIWCNSEEVENYCLLPKSDKDDVRSQE